MKLPSPSSPSPAGDSATSPGTYQKILFRLKHLGRPVATWMEAFRDRKLPLVGGFQSIPGHIRRLPGVHTFSPDAVITDVASSRGLLVIYMTVQQRFGR